MPLDPPLKLFRKLKLLSDSFTRMPVPADRGSVGQPVTHHVFLLHILPSAFIVVVVSVIVIVNIRLSLFYLTFIDSAGFFASAIYININHFCSIFLFSGYIFRNFLCLEIYWTSVLTLSLNFYPRVLFFTLIVA